LASQLWQSGAATELSCVAINGPLGLPRVYRHLLPARYIHAQRMKGSCERDATDDAPGGEYDPAAPSSTQENEVFLTTVSKLKTNCFGTYKVGQNK